MDQPLGELHRSKVQEFLRKHRIGLLTLLFTDIVGSTKLKQVLGDAAAVMHITQHHQLLRGLLKEFNEAEEINTAGDSFFVVFARPSDALRFALLLQSRLRVLAQESGVPILDRVGIHVGEVVINESGLGDGGKDLYGIQVDNCARIMSLAEGDQILMSRVVFDNARQVLRGQELEGLGELSWLNHGLYLMKGIEDAVEVCEVGERGKAVLAEPKDSEKARRQSTPDGEIVLGWRPAVGQAVPNTRWVLEEKLGEGGFGEVWLGRHETLKQQRVFKFCFRADRVRSLRRELTLLRVLREKAGEHPNIVAVEDVFFDKPPFYLMMEYVAGRDLLAWCMALGGVDKVPVEARLEIVAQMAEALQAAHEAGVIHRDVKPSNILISAESELRSSAAIPHSALRTPQLMAKLTDFGIGQVVSQEVLAGITRLGFTQTMMTTGSQTGSQMYMAPELLAGQPASTRSDLYALGVVMYQLLIGDFARPLTTDWAKSIDDPLLREDLQQCFAGNLRERFASAGQLAVNLRSLEKRRVALKVRERAAFHRGMIRTAAVAAVIIAIMAGLAWIAKQQLDESRHRLARTFVARGMRLVEEGDLFGSLAWFGEALSLDRGNKSKEEAHCLRIATILRQCPRPVQFFPDHEGVAFSLDGNRIVTRSIYDTVAGVWDAATGKPVIPFLKHDRYGVYHASFSADGRRVITTSGDKVRVWDAATGKAVFPPLNHNNSDNSVENASFSPDGHRILTASRGDGARLWDAATGVTITPSLLHTAVVFQASFSLDGHRILTASGDTALVWDTVKGELLIPPLRHSNNVLRASFSPDGRRIVTASFDKTARVWNAATGELVSPPIQHGDYIVHVSFSRDGDRILTASADRAQVFDAFKGKPLTAPLSHRRQYVDWSQPAFSPDGHWVATISAAQMVQVWNAFSGKPVLPPFRHISYGVGRVTFSPDGHRLMTTAGGSTWLWSLITEGFDELWSNTNKVDCVEFNVDSRRIVTAGADFTARIWDLDTGQLLNSLLPHSSNVLFASFSPRGDRVVTASADFTARVWDANTGNPITPPLQHSGSVLRASFSPDGRLVLTATGLPNPTARVWDSATGKPLTSALKNDLYWPWRPSISPDGHQVVTVSFEPTPEHWDKVKHDRIETVTPGKGSFQHVSFCSDGRLIILSGGGLGSREHQANVWNKPSTLRHKFGLRYQPRLTVGHNDDVKDASFSLDGRRLVTASADMTSRVWDVSTGKPITPPFEHKEAVWSASFSPNGSLVVTTSADKSVRIWDASTGDLAIPPLVHGAEVKRATFSADGQRLLTLSGGTVRVWELPRDNRPVEDLILLARFLAGGRIDKNGGFEVMDSATYKSAWQTLKSKYPADFTPRSSSPLQK